MDTVVTLQGNVKKIYVLHTKQKKTKQTNKIIR